MNNPLRLLLVGCNGYMGQVISRLAANRDDCTVVGGVDKNTAQPFGYPVFETPDAVTVDFDCIIDFSHPSVCDAMLQFACEQKKPLVLATTGLSLEQIERVEGAAAVIPIFRSANMSVGVNVLRMLCRRAAAALPGFDIEIIERHHNRKVDAPSGTALMLADSINEVLDMPCDYVYDRHAVRQKRSKHEIGMHAVRGGTIVGEHEVLFAGIDETISLTHSAASREVFANGAICAALYLDKQPAGMYDMDAMLQQMLG